jgi:hypothetical protein
MARRRIVPMMRQQIKANFDKAMRGDVTDDVGLQSFRKAQQAAGQALVGAQARELNRGAMAAAGGGPVQTGQFAEATANLAQKANEGQQITAGEEAAFRNKLREQNRDNAMQEAAALAQMNAEKVKQGFEIAGSVLELGNQFANPGSILNKAAAGIYRSLRQRGES